jgi:predicted nucleotidyltransferase component of viral defense system
MVEFIKLPNEDKLAAYSSAADQVGVEPHIVEKDFWVCWTLKQIFESEVLNKYLTFKGGTSLSKAYGIINRFSEDIDLAISKSAPLLSNLEQLFTTSSSKLRLVTKNITF